jgi:methyl-accepting chemotaxis protein
VFLGKEFEMLKRLRDRGVGFNPLRNVKLRTKMTVGFLIIIVFVAFLGYNSAGSITKAGNEAAQLEQALVPGASALLELEAAYSSLFKEMEGYLASGGEDNLNDVLNYVLSIQQSVDEYIVEEVQGSAGSSEAANQIKEQSDSILVLVQRVMGTGQDIQRRQSDLNSLGTAMYQEAVELSGILEVQIEVNADKYAETQASVANSISLGSPDNPTFNFLTQDVVPFWVVLLETDSTLGNMIREVDQAAATGDLAALTENVDLYREQIQANTAELESRSVEMGDDTVVMAKDVAARAANILDLTQGYLQEVDSYVAKQTELDGLKQEMYADADVLGDLLDVQVNERLGEVDASIAAVNAVQASGRRAILFIGFGALAAAVLLRFVVVQDILRSIDAISQTCSEIGMGNFDARVEVTSHDELGETSETLNAMLDNTLGLIQTREERDAMQASIQKLLREVSGVADGDLTVEAEVTADMTGAIADSFNLMIGQLREIITGVQQATQKVSASANEIQARTEQLSRGSESQALQIAETSGAIEEMATSIAQVSESATMSASVGEQSLVNAKQGTLAVQNTMQGMNRIRDQVQETAKRIKRLGESSQEIGEIVELISDIADRTSILSLNASIQAAMAGEAGQGFAVVAEEVERLAERSLQATQQIETLIRTIQTETNEAVAAMEATTNEVVSGTKLAEEAGNALNEIEAVSVRLAELSQSISLAAQQQARGSENVAKAMSEIAEITQQTAEGTKDTAVSINSLARMADELRVSVSAFKLPSDGMHAMA